MTKVFVKFIIIQAIFHVKSISTWVWVGRVRHYHDFDKIFVPESGSKDIKIRTKVSVVILFTLVAVA